MRRLAFAGLLAAAGIPALAQQGETLTFEQVERRYPRMKEVHILRCDYDGNRIFTRTEVLCVSGIYQQMYLDSD